MEIVSYILLPTKRTKTIYRSTLKLEGLKKTSCCFNILETHKRKFNISMEKREAGLKSINEKGLFFFRGKKLHLMKHKVLLLKL